MLAQAGVIVGFAGALTHALVGGDRGAAARRAVGIRGHPGIPRRALGVLLIAASERTSARGAAAVGAQLREALIAAVTRLGPRWLGARNTAALAVTAGPRLEALDAYFGRYLPSAGRHPAITMPILIGAMTLADPLSGLTVVLTIRSSRCSWC